MKRSILVLVLLFGGGWLVQSQDDTFVTSDGTFSLEIPAGWSGREQPTGAILLEQNATLILVFHPLVLERDGFRAAKYQPADLINIYMNRLGDRTEVDESAPFAERNDLLVAHYIMHDDNSGATGEGLILVMTLANSYVMVDIAADDLASKDLELTITELVDTFTINEAALRVQLLADRLATLNDDRLTLNGPWEEAIATLAEHGFIATGGRRVLAEDMLMSAFDEGANFDLDSEHPAGDFVIAGTISWRVMQEGDFVVCGLLSRITELDTDSLFDSDFLMVAPTSDDMVLIAENEGRAEEPRIVLEESPVDFTVPHHLLYIVRDQTLTIFVDGELLLENLSLTLPTDDNDPRYETVYAGTLLTTSCVMTNVWAYAVDPTGEEV